MYRLSQRSPISPKFVGILIKYAVVGLRLGALVDLLGLRMSLLMLDK